ncbi:MAG TPA: DUF2993 domain-containing protein [Micromonosporaceae bacterium]|jgi:hypothetical protein
MAVPQRIPQPRRTSRRRPGLWQPLLGIVLVLAVLLAVGDRVASALAARELRNRIATELAAHDVGYSSLDVTIAGVPFLTQLARGRYESIHITMADVQLSAEGHQVALPALTAVANGVSIDAVELAQGHESATADTVTGSAVVSYPTLAELLDLSQYHVVDLGFQDRDGALWATAHISLAGLDLPIEASAAVTVDGGRIELRLRDARAVGVPMPAVGLPALDQLMNAAIVATIPRLPFGIGLDALTVTPGGLAVSASGRAVTLVAPRSA